MLQWLASRAWDKRSAERVESPLEAAPFVLRPNKLYRATVRLSGFFETMASNDMIADKFRSLGFKDPKVTGSGGVRQGEAIWPGAEKSITLPIDPHLSDVAEVA